MRKFILGISAALVIGAAFGPSAFQSSAYANPPTNNRPAFGVIPSGVCDDLVHGIITPDNPAFCTIVQRCGVFTPQACFIVTLP